MEFIKYAGYRIKYHDALTAYDAIITEKERIFAKTQPRGVDTEAERVSGGVQKNTFDEYLIEMEAKEIEKRLKEAAAIVADRKRLLDLCEQDLRASANCQDKVYRYRYIDHLSVRQIAQRVGYSEANVYHLLNAIRLQLRQIEKLDVGKMKNTQLDKI
jgi:DNA-directed RNA polymerase specialized sigma24 family protein